MAVKQNVAKISVFSNASLLIMKIVIGVSINSVSVLSEAIHSGIDLLAALIALFAVYQSEKPPDEEHQFGHGKFENVAGFVEALLIFGAATWIVWEAAQKIATKEPVVEPLWGLAVMTVSGTVNLVVSSVLMKTARLTDSVALEADAWHLRTDVYTSFGVGVGLLLLWVTGSQIFDPLLAIGVALLIIKTSFELAKRAFLPLLDTCLPEEEIRMIREILEQHRNDYIEFRNLRTRKAGSERHIDFHLVVPRDRRISEVHELCQQIERSIQQRFPGSSVLIHLEPSEVEKEVDN